MKKNRNVSFGDNEELVRMGRTLAIVLLFLGSVYLLFAIFSGEIKLSDRKKEVEINYEEILAGSISFINNNEYYVLLYNFSKKGFDEVLSLTKYQPKSVFTVDLEKGFNANFVAVNPSEKNLKSLENLKVTSPTLIKVSNKSIVSTFEKNEEIKKELLKLVRHE